MVSLKDIIKKRGDEERVKKERNEYKKHGVEVPVTHWTSKQMLDYFLVLKKKRGLKLIEIKDNRSMITSLGAIKRTELNGVQWVEFTNWLDQQPDGVSTIWFAIKKIPTFKKERSDLFVDEEFNDDDSE